MFPEAPPATQTPLGVSDADVNTQMQNQRAIENQRELLSLYKLIATTLKLTQQPDGVGSLAVESAREALQ